MTASHPGRTSESMSKFGTPAVAMIALGAALGRTREDTGQPVGAGGRNQDSTPNGPDR